MAQKPLVKMDDYNEKWHWKNKTNKNDKAKGARPSSTNISVEHTQSSTNMLDQKGGEIENTMKGNTAMTFQDPYLKK